MDSIPNAEFNQKLHFYAGTKPSAKTHSTKSAAVSVVESTKIDSTKIRLNEKLHFHSNVKPSTKMDSILSARFNQKLHLTRRVKVDIKIDSTKNIATAKRAASFIMMDAIVGLLLLAIALALMPAIDRRIALNQEVERGQRADELALLKRLEAGSPSPSKEIVSLHSRGLNLEATISQIQSGGASYWLVSDVHDSAP